MAEETKMEAEASKTPVQETKTTVTKKGSSNKMVLIIVVVLLLCCCCSLVAGGIYLYQRGRSLTPADILNNNGFTPPGFFNPVPNTGDSSNSNNGSSNDNSYSTTLPSGFPTDVPIYPNAKVMFGVKNDTDSYSASLSATASNADVISYYKAEVVKKGWTIESEGNVFGYVVTAKKDTRELNIVVLELKDDNGKAVQSITIAVEPKN